MGKRLLIMIGSLFLGILLLGGCGSDNGSSKKEAAPKKLIVGLDDQFPPMGFRNEKNEIVGFDIDLAKEVGKRIGVEFEFKAIDWGSKEAELTSGRVDLLWNGLTILEERKKNVLFTDPYMANRQIVIVKKGTPIRTKADLSGKIVAVQEDSSGMNSVLKENAVSDTFQELKKYPDFLSAFIDLENGRIEALVGDEVLTRYYMEKNPGKFEAVDGMDFGVEAFGVGLKKEDTQLKEKIDKAMKEMKADGSAAKISTQWFGKNLVE